MQELVSDSRDQIFVENSLVKGVNQMGLQSHNVFNEAFEFSERRVFLALAEKLEEF